MKINISIDNKILIGIGLALLGIAIIAFTISYSKNKSKTIIQYVEADYTDRVMGHSGSSIDSERQYLPSEQWKGQSSKCYDCERDMQARCGDAAVFNATKQKLFSI